jgi:hypothetical protein
MTIKEFKNFSITIWCFKNRKFDVSTICLFVTLTFRKNGIRTSDFLNKYRVEHLSMLRKYGFRSIFIQVTVGNLEFCNLELRKKCSTTFSTKLLFLTFFGP